MGDDPGDQMNIGIFTHDLYPYKPWGQGRYVYDLVRYLRGHRRGTVYIFSPSEGIEDPFHVQIFPGSHQSPGKNISFSVKLSVILPGLIRKYSLDIVHFQGGPGGLFLLNKPCVPTVFTVHHTYFQQSAYIPAQRWKRLLYVWEKYSYHMSDYLLCDSDSTRDIIRRHYGIDKTACETVPVGVDRHQFHDLGYERIPQSLFFLGRLEARKGIDFLIRTLPNVARVMPGVVLYIGGQGGLRASIEAFAANHDIQKNMVFLGHIEDSDLIKWYNRVSAVVIPSVFEGFGLTAVEAMACRTPVIATRVDALKDSIDHDIDGILVPYGDGKALCRAITGLLADKPRQRRFSDAGIQKINRCFDWEKIVEKIWPLYHEIAMKNKVPGQALS